MLAENVLNLITLITMTPSDEWATRSTELALECWRKAKKANSILAALEEYMRPCTIPCGLGGEPVLLLPGVPLPIGVIYTDHSVGYELPMVSRRRHRKILDAIRTALEYTEAANALVNAAQQHLQPTA